MRELLHSVALRAGPGAPGVGISAIDQPLIDQTVEQENPL